jgi:hypothetical protein
VHALARQARGLSSSPLPLPAAYIKRETDSLSALPFVRLVIIDEHLGELLERGLLRSWRDNAAATMVTVANRLEDLEDTLIRARASSRPAVVCLQIDREANLAIPGELMMRFAEVYQGPMGQ